MTVTNTSPAAIAGPVSVVLTNLTPGVGMTNSGGTFNGDPFITLPGVATFNPGQAATVSIQFTNPSNGYITFTPVTYSGPFPPAPVGLTCPAVNAQAGVPYNSSLVATGGVQPYTYSISGTLPPPLVLNSSAGAITGTPSGSGNYAFTAKVVDETATAGGTITTPCNIQVGTPPAFTSANTATFKVETAGTFSITTSGIPAVTSITRTGSLGTTGLTFTDNGNGTATLSGTPAAGSGGPYTLNLTAVNGVTPNGTQTLTVNVNQPPAFTSANNVTFPIGVAGSFSITTSGFPAVTSLTRTGSLGTTGLTFTDNGNGTATLSETPAANSGGTYPLNLTATNAIAPDATQTLTVTVNRAPAFASANTATFKVGTAGTFSITTSGSPTVTSITRTGSLGTTGLIFTDNGNGTATLGGTPAAGSGGTYPLSLTATNGVAPNATQTLTVTVNQPPAFTSANNVTLPIGVAGSFSITTSGFPAVTSITRTGSLGATGLTFTDNGNGTATLSGTPGAGSGGTYPLNLTATNGTAPDATQTLTVTVNQAPAFTSANAATFKVVRREPSASPPAARRQ